MHCLAPKLICPQIDVFSFAEDAALQTHSQQQSPAEAGTEVQLEVCVATLQLQAGTHGKQYGEPIATSTSTVSA